MISLFPKASASTQLPLNPNDWDAEIITLFTSQYVELVGHIKSIEYTNVDRSSGAATGFILLDDSVRIPVLINNFRLSPLDIFISKDGTYGYLTKDTASWIAASEWPFKTLSLKEYASIRTQNIINPTSIIKHASDEELLEIGVGLKSLGEPAIFDKIASTNKQNITPGITEYHTVMHDKYKPIRSSDGKKYSMEKFAQDMGDSALETLMTTGECIVVESDGMCKISSLIAVTKDNSNRTFEGHLFDLLDLATGNGTGKSMVVMRDGKYSFAKPEEVKGGDISYSPVKASIGDKILLLKSDATAYGPFILESKGNVDGEDRVLISKTGDHSMVNLTFVDGIKDISQLSADKFAVPSIWSISKLTEPIGSIKTAEDVTADITIEKKNGEYLINHVGALPDNIPSGGQVPMDKAAAVLVYLGKTAEKALDIVANMGDGDKVKISVNKTAIEKTAGGLKPNDIVENIRGTAVAILKTAEEAITEPQTLDMVLGLGLITQSSIAQYKAIIPAIKTTINDLCKVLIAKRINPVRIDIPETQLSMALRGLTDIISDIRRL